MIKPHSAVWGAVARVGRGAIRFYLPLNVQLPNPFFSQAVIVAKDVPARNRLQAKLEKALAEDFPSVVGRVFQAKVLPGVHPDLGSLEDVRADLGALGTADLVKLDRDEDESYLFKHAVTQQVAYESIPHSLLPCAQFRFVVRIVQRKHWPRVRHLHKPILRLAANPLRRRIQRHPLRMLRLQPLQLVHQRVVLRIRNLRSVLNVVKMFVMAQRIAQRLQLLFRRKFPRHRQDYKEVAAKLISQIKTFSEQ